jgi:hypothetical protein
MVTDQCSLRSAIRLLASLICDLGLPDLRFMTKRKTGELLVNKHGKVCRDMWEAFSEGLDGIERWNRHWIAGVTQDMKDKLFRQVDISAVCVYDTVSSLGDPGHALSPAITPQSTQYKFTEEIHTRPRIKHFFHALALAERRRNFKPVLLHNKLSDQIVEQTWFPFFHSSVGGAIDKRGQRATNICLLWMLSRLWEHKVIPTIDLDDTEFTKGFLLSEQDKAPSELKDMQKMPPYLGTPSHKRHREVKDGVNMEDMFHITIQPDKCVQYVGHALPQPAIKVINLVADALSYQEPTQLEKEWLDRIATSGGDS